jgi:hypothetical protein
MSKKKQYCKVVANGEFRVGQTKNGHPQLEIGLKVVDAQKSNRMVGDVVTFYKVVVLDNDDSVRYAVESMRALGMSNRDIFSPIGLGTVVASLCDVWETYEGNSSWRPSFVNEIKERKSLSDNEANDFASAMERIFAQTESVTIGDHNRAPEVLPPQQQRQQQQDDGDLF